MSIYARGTRSCTGCDWNKKHARVQRAFDLNANRWRFYRVCTWCGCCYPTTEVEYWIDHPDELTAIAAAKGTDHG